MSGPRFVETTRRKPVEEPDDRARTPVLVIAHHSSLARVGGVLALPRVGDTIELSRLAPAFDAPLERHGSEPAPLDDPFVSRKPIVIRRLADAIEIINPNGVELAIGGVALDAGSGGCGGVRRIAIEELTRGIDIVLGGRVALWLTTDHAGATDELGMFGASRSMQALRAEIRAAARAIAPGSAPILVEGETGAGKELVARALHGCSRRSDKPFVAVNIAAIPAAVATAELFGHERGAFTGASERRAGYFERADGGVLFLDEIGDVPESVQPTLLRALESGEIQPVGGQPRRVDTAIVAATDADLAMASRAGRYRGPLYYRLASTTLRVPPLRERRVDIGPLLARMLLDQLEPPHVDRATDPTPWLPASLVAELLRASWPGNVRQLRAVASKLAAIARAGKTATLADLGHNLGLDDDSAPDLAATALATTTAYTPDLAATKRSTIGATNVGATNVGATNIGATNVATNPDAAIPATNLGATKLDDAKLVATLREHRFHLARTAEALGISRTHLDALIARSGTLRKAKDLGRDEIAACAAELADDIDAMAAKLEVSPRGLRLRMRQLGL